ncbi:MAG: response regulator transcription factor [Chloroflexota bacterium]|nr:response regulator transcription factor [Chloroflexota bacterium]
MAQDKGILLVDDDLKILEFTQHHLQRCAYRVVTATNGRDALDLFQRDDIGLVILDIMMPQQDGLETCRVIRQTSTVPIILLSALDDEADKIAALDMGADDYLTKPFSVMELLARVRSVLRRARWEVEPRATGVLRVGALTIDFTQRALWRDEAPIRLTATEFSVLETLALDLNKVVLSEAILISACGYDYRHDLNALRVHIARLRRKIECDPAHPRYILTELGKGYRMTADTPDPLP